MKPIQKIQDLPLGDLDKSAKEVYWLLTTTCKQANKLAAEAGATCHFYPDRFLRAASWSIILRLTVGFRCLVVGGTAKWPRVSLVKQGDDLLKGKETKGKFYGYALDQDDLSAARQNSDLPDSIHYWLCVPPHIEQDPSFTDSLVFDASADLIKEEYKSATNKNWPKDCEMPDIIIGKKDRLADEMDYHYEINTEWTAAAAGVFMALLEELDRAANSVKLFIRPQDE